MTVKEVLVMQKSVARKLMSAIAMLLVSAIMLGTSSYAWVTMSVSPEVKEMKTTAGANGTLEIALQSPASEGSSTRAAQIQHRDGDSLLTVRERNKTWGNVVELGTQYGLDQISLYPARLNVSADKKVSTDGYLSIPQFGSDGRISKMERASFLTYNGNPATPYTEGRTYGVNILGTVGGEVAEDETITYHYRRSMIRDEAAGYLEQYRSSLRGEVIDLLESQEVGIFNLLLRATQLLNSSGEITGNTWTADNVATAKTIINRMIVIVRNSEVSLKWALLARAVADDVTYPSDDEEAMAELGELYRSFLTYPLTSTNGGTSIRSIAEDNGYTDIVDAVDSIIRAENQLGVALTEVSSDDTVTNGFLKIIDVQNTFLKNGTEIETDGAGTGNPATGIARTLYAKEGNVTYGMTYNAARGIKSDYLYFTGNPNGETLGLFSIMANLLGDYQCTDRAYFSARPVGFYADSNNGARTQYTLFIRGTGKTAVSRFNTDDNRGVLGTVYDDIMAYDPGNAMISFSTEKRNGSAYGYSVDLAFQASKSCDLLLQQEALDRVLGVNEKLAKEQGADSRLMGDGSTAKFTLSGDLTGTNSGIAKELIDNIFVVLIDTDSGAILGIVAADETSVVLEQAEVSLALYEPRVSADGILSRGEKRSSNIITPMTAEQPVYITAIVFLNGDTLPSGAVAATQHPSLYGTVNLQFSSNADLTPMNYSGYVGSGG